MERWADRPHADVKLWRHHAAQPQADRINTVAAHREEPWLPRYGGLISSRWEFAKALQVLKEDPEHYAAMVWPVHRLHALPGEMTAEDGAVLEPLGVALHEADLARLRPDRLRGLPRATRGISP